MFFYDREVNEKFDAAVERYVDALGNSGTFYLEAEVNRQHEVTLTEKYIFVKRAYLFGKSKIYLFPTSSLKRVVVEKKDGDPHLRMEFSALDKLYDIRMKYYTPDELDNDSTTTMDVGKCGRHKLNDLLNTVKLLMDQKVVDMCVVEGATLADGKDEKAEKSIGKIAMEWVLVLAIGWFGFSYYVAPGALEDARARSAQDYTNEIEHQWTANPERLAKEDRVAANYVGNCLADKLYSGMGRFEGAIMGATFGRVNFFHPLTKESVMDCAQAAKEKRQAIKYQTTLKRLDELGRGLQRLFGN